jgi:hypothetical protein
VRALPALGDGKMHDPDEADPGARQTTGCDVMADFELEPDG